MLWLHGPHGEDGKSTMASIIGKELFGPAHNAISNASIGSSEKRFLNSFFENASLVIYPDANNSKCLMSEAFKTVASAGADPVLIERKGRQAYTAKLKARMWICSNHAPEVTKDNYAVSRLLYVHIDKMVDEKPDPTVFSRLTNELPGFLAYAQKCYLKRCPDNYRIETDVSTKERVAQLSDDFYDEYETIFTKYWQTSALTERVEASKLRDIVRQEGLNSNTAYSNFVRWLTTQMQIEKRKLSKEGGKIFFYGMSKRSLSQTPSSDEPDF
jgi:phage/plasmid-associated DNA primase